MRHKKSIVLVCVALVLGFAVAAFAWEEPELEDIMLQAVVLEEKVHMGLACEKKPAAAEAAMNLAALFDDIENFWERKGVESSQERSRDVAVRARAVAGLVERGDFDGAKLAAENMAANCRGCHRMHAEPCVVE